MGRPSFRERRGGAEAPRGISREIGQVANAGIRSLADASGRPSLYASCDLNNREVEMEFTWKGQVLSLRGRGAQGEEEAGGLVRRAYDRPSSGRQAEAQRELAVACGGRYVSPLR